MRGGGDDVPVVVSRRKTFFLSSFLFSLSVGDPATNKRRRPFGRHNQNTHSRTRSLSLTRENSHSDNSDRRTRVGRGEDDTHTTDRTKTKRTQSARILIIHVPMRPDAMQQRAHLAPIEKWSLP